MLAESFEEQECSKEAAGRGRVEKEASKEKSRQQRDGIMRRDM